MELEWNGMGLKAYLNPLAYLLHLFQMKSMWIEEDISLSYKNSDTMSNSTTLSSSSLELSTLVEGCLIPLVAIFGTLGNLASISVLRDKNLDMKETFRWDLYMTSWMSARVWAMNPPPHMQHGILGLLGILWSLLGSGHNHPSNMSFQNFSWPGSTIPW